MSNKILIPTGYMGSGSSAATDLVSELEGFDDNHGSYEYVFLHCPDGVFDLEDKLLRGNNALRSDEAIHRFLQCMRRLHYERNYWFSDYAVKVTPRFYPLCREFVAALQPVTVNETYWYYQEDIDRLPRRVLWHLRRAASALLRRHIPRDRPYKPLRYTDVQMAFPDPDAFYAAARALLGALYEELGYARHHLVLDQLLLPHNLFRLNDYFDENARVIVVERDPRDVFLLNKYLWFKDHVAVPFPLEAEDYCRYYSAMRQAETPVEDARVLRVRFEDLIYRYDDSCRRIYPFLGVSDRQHERLKGTKFNPEISIRNTQLFRRPEYPAEEIRRIEKELERYLYDFPADTAVRRTEGPIF